MIIRAEACAVTLDGVRRLYGGRAAVDGVSLALPAGQITALLGPSGSGKSTILRLIAGLEPIDAGAILFGGETMSTPTRTVPPEARRVGVVFQDYALFPHLTIAGNVAFGLAHLDRDARDREASEWLARVGLAGRAHSYPHMLSGGEQQRVALARALAPAPRAVLLDEPFSGLDPVLRAELRDTTLDTLRAARATAVFVTHDADEALHVADRLAILKAGALIQEDLPRTVYEAPLSVDAAAALGPINRFVSRANGGGAATPLGPVATDLPDGARALVVVRCEALSLTPGGDGARVIDVRPQGASDYVRLAVGDQIWRALTPARAGFKVGDNVAARIDPAGAHVFLG